MRSWEEQDEAKVLDFWIDHLTKEGFTNIKQTFEFEGEKSITINFDCLSPEGKEVSLSVKRTIIPFYEIE